ncbi:uncharacterized protein LOC122570259 [Bombus pyrosoma]|uniref:uncharacterized protein LOC122570259 n=1 Tax=Bombus pyrosoma TaxID=396416 RepID=UPI001CB91EDB|nr:uncharacterized protein LOC122570259 [Bombus pyrosoma]
MVWPLTYADDIVLMADREEELKEMLKRFEKFLNETELELSTEKIKIKNGSDEKHIQERKKRATIATKKTWSVGERIFKQDYKRRIKMFGAEIWGWNMEERLDKIQRRYVKWILGLGMTTPNYILIEECKLTEIKEKALRRAAKYEGRAIESKKELKR